MVRLTGLGPVALGVEVMLHVVAVVEGTLENAISINSLQKR